MDENKIKDSGNSQEFKTGAVRDRQKGKGRFDLLPYVALYLVSRIFEDGAEKYSDRNWEKGMPVSRYVDSAQRHLAKYMDGLRDEPHLSMAGWNVLCALWTAVRVYLGLLPAEFNDVPSGVLFSKHEEESLKNWYGK